MKTFYKIFLILFIVVIGINIYAIDWHSSLFEEENSKFVFSGAAGILGIIVVYIMHNWSKLGIRK
ncbi:hypothetical protein SAMN05660493_02810 [Epilithonimonas bovis DSM 19482]|jgi:hypothetical protein|uniref:Uncharacterized protein n=1 Tax=Epilithonimonas bovis DSM 19482 TaxID=1121284 RepID=A0A1U7PZ85_9FLAO|nr:hypothetical protein [Epilithonimonas bovis]MDN5627296.1 hypothetical protein [Weeksellaceae bacterium]QIY82606.1 hypothetical protein HER18_03150 [Chryseobacterium sp. NEB161]SIT98077.1 hypothetical protein SAMN05660493_02810 [Epilithonimonas bovis DSM 19482]HBR12373.1 hypothetical protein [Chryseobacterium sp.]